MAERVCPVWIGYLLASPVRKLFQNPIKIVGPFVEEGMQVLDIGCAMGFFSLPLAQLVGSKGNVICVDVQEKMIASLDKRAQRAALSDRIQTRICEYHSLGLSDIREKIDFALASAVVHEVPDAANFFSEIFETLKPGAKLLVVEPKWHVSERDFAATVSIAEAKGFQAVGNPRISTSRAALFKKRLPTEKI